MLHDFHRWPGSLALILYSLSRPLRAAENAPFAGLTRVSAEQFVAAILAANPALPARKPLGEGRGRLVSGSPRVLAEASKPMFVDYMRRSVMSRHAQKLLVIATLLLTGGATLVTHAIELAGQDATRADHEALASRYEQEASSAQAKADEYRKTLEWYERPGNGTYATVKGGLINRLNYLVRKYQAVAEQNLALAKSHRVGVVDNSNQTGGARTRHR